jgi:hypothetical protein
MVPALLPKVLSFLVAKYAHENPQTKLWSIYGVYTSVSAAEFPAAQPVTVYLEVTNLRTPTNLRLLLVDADESRPPLFEKPIPLGAFDPHFVLVINYDHGAVIVPAPGVYRLQLFAQDNLIAERLLEVRLAGGQARAPARDDD